MSSNSQCALRTLRCAAATFLIPNNLRSLTRHGLGHTRGEREQSVTLKHIRIGGEQI